MLSPLVAVSVSASRTSLDEHLEPEKRSSRIWITQPNEVRVVLAGSSDDDNTTNDAHGTVASVRSNHIVVEGGVCLPQQMSMPSIESRDQHIDALASAVFHKLLSGDEVITVMHGPSGCGKTVSLFGHELDLAHPTKQPPSPSEGLLWHVLSRVFSLSAPTSEDSHVVVDLGLSVIEFRQAGSPSADDDEGSGHEEAVDLLRDSVDVVTATGAFSNMPCDVPLAQYVVCRDVLEFRTALMVALSRSQSWVPDDPQHIAMSDVSGESRLEHSHRTTGDIASNRSRGPATASHPLIPTLGSSSHLNLNIIVKVTQPLETSAAGPTSTSSSRANRALNVAQDEALPAVVDTRTICSVWRVFDMMGPQLFDFSANPVAEMATRTERSLIDAAMSPLQSSRVVQPGEGGGASVVALLPAPAPYNPDTGSLCAHVVTSLLRQGCAHVVWICSLRFDYAFDELNAEAVRLASWVRERCGRPLVLQATQKTMKEKHLHVARRLMDSHALPSRAYFSEVMDLRRSTVGSRYAALTYHMALSATTAGQPRPQHHRQPQRHRTVANATVSPQSISLDGAVSEAASSEYGVVHTASRSAMERSVTSIDVSRSVSRAAAGAQHYSALQTEGRRASFALETPPESKALPQASHCPKNAPRKKNHDDIAHAVELLEASLHSRRLHAAAARHEDDDSDGGDSRRSLLTAASEVDVVHVHRSQSTAAQMAAQAVTSSYAATRRGSSSLEENHNITMGPPGDPASATMSSAGNDSWRSVLEQFRGTSGVPVPAPPEHHEVPVGVADNLLQPSKGGTFPRGASEGPHVAREERRLPPGLGPQPGGSFATAMSAEVSVYERGESTRLLTDELSALRAEADVLRRSETDAHEMLRQQQEELRLSRQMNESTQGAASMLQQHQYHDGGASAIAQLVQPILSRLEEDSAAVMAKLLTTKRREADEDAAHATSAEREGDSASMRNLNVLQRRASPQKHNRGGVPSASIHDVAELQRRVKGLQRELHMARDQHEKGRVEVLDAANRSIASHKEAFTKILNESGAMYAKLNRSYHEAAAANREITLRLDNVTDECRSLRQELAVRTATEERLRKAVTQLQRDNERFLRHESMQNAVSTVSTMFANASVTSCESGASTSDASRRGAASNDNRCVFDTSIQPSGPGFGILGTSRKKNNHSVAMSDVSSQRTHAEAIGMLSFSSALNHLYRAATGPMDAAQSSLRYSVEALRSTPAATTDVIVAQVAKSLESLVDEIEKRKLQTQLHTDIVKEEAAKVDTMHREIQQREQQYLQVLISR
jgi:hypothetical protein